VIGIDADARAMADASRRAAASSGRGGVPNALFLVAAAETLPGALSSNADFVTVVLPWGSLLRGLLTGDPRLISALAGLLRPGAELEILISSSAKDRPAANAVIATERDLAPLVAGLESAGLRVVECRPAVESDVKRLSSGWGKRLGIPRRRAAWLVRARSEPQVASSVSGTFGSRPL
jgi:16S rRNA (adenine(1408)-N(1))-methyltransferase